MDGSRFHGGHFKHYAFLWKSSFSQQQTKTYTAENTPLVQPQTTHNILHLAGSTAPGPVAAIPVSNEEIVQRFVYNKCTNDLDRYKSNRLQIGSFLESADIDTIRGPPEQSVMKPMALIDDRNNQNVTRTQLAGNCRPPRGPLSAQQLFIELSRDVRPNSNLNLFASLKLMVFRDSRWFHMLQISWTQNVV